MGAVSEAASLRIDSGSCATGPAPGVIDAAGAASGAAPAGSVLHGFLDLVVRLAGASAGAIRSIAPGNSHLQLVVSVGLPNEILARDALMPIGCGICGAALRDDDTRRATRTIGCGVRGCGPSATDTECAIAVPLDYQGRPIGVLNLFFAADRDPPDCVSLLLRPFGELLGMALENEKLSRENLHARVLAERQLMASEIHDAVAQSLTFARMRMSLLEGALAKQDPGAATAYCGDVSTELRQAHGRLRELITHFRAGMDSRGLLASLHDIASGFNDRAGIPLDFDCRVDSLPLTPEQETQVFNIVQEALSNVRKHANARRARLALIPCNDALEISIEDDGRGLPAPPPPAGRSLDGERVGLSIMQERAVRAGGCLRIDSPVSGGTRVRLLLPVPGMKPNPMIAGMA
jgi:two-component system nitrate/nitrite sensor histidine kinase NarX